jgi:predicted dehydrogenase
MNNPTDMPDRKKKIGMIGAGWIAEKAHLQALSLVENAVLAGIYDPDKKKADVLADKFGISKVYNSVEDLLEADIDAVVIATPNSTHYSIVTKALQHGKHVLCEKPVVRYAAEMRSIMELAKKEGKILMPGFVNRFRDDIGMLKNVLAEDGPSDIVSIRAGWLRRNGIPRPGTWITSKELSGGGVLVDLGSHLIDICLMLLPDNDPATTQAHLQFDHPDPGRSAAGWLNNAPGQGIGMDVEHSIRGDIGFRNQVQLSVELSWSADIKNDLTFIHIIGKDGFLNLKTLFGFSTDRSFREDSLLTSLSGQLPARTIWDPARNAQHRAFHRMAAHFVDCMNEEAMPLVTAEDALRTVSLIEQLYQ